MNWWSNSYHSQGPGNVYWDAIISTTKTDHHLLTHSLTHSLTLNFIKTAQNTFHLWSGRAAAINLLSNMWEKGPWPTSTDRYILFCLHANEHNASHTVTQCQQTTGNFIQLNFLLQTGNNHWVVQAEHGCNKSKRAAGYLFVSLRSQAKIAHCGDGYDHKLVKCSTVWMNLLNIL